MTNEEFTEEIYHEAFEQGYIDELRATIDKFDPRLSHSERVQLAYYTLKNPSSTDSGSALSAFLLSKGVNP